MLISLAWLNSMLDGAPMSADDVERVLTDVGFPIESREAVGTDTRLDVEITSNRGDCLSHVGLAREIAAKTGRALKISQSKPGAAAGPIAQALMLRTDAGAACPRFTARVIEGIKVGPSPDWLVKRLEAVGQRSINNVVDATNYVSFELGNPSHVFDLDRLAGNTLHVRYAKDKEPLKTLDGKSRTLHKDELVVADASRAQSLAGVIGGGDSEVSSATTRVVVEVATWDPVHVRRAARAHQVRTDSSHRFERVVRAATLDAAMDRLCGLIQEIAGGTIREGTLSVGDGDGDAAQIRLRPSRVRDILGYEIDTPRIVQILRSLSVEVGPLGRAGDDLLCVAPAWRPDLTREIDLIEEVARINGLDAIPVLDGLRVIARGAQHTEKARRGISHVLAGLGFYETVTFTFVTRDEADLFMPAGLKRVEVDEARRAGAPALRPSIVPSLLACRRQNQHGGVRIEGGVRLFETAAIMAEHANTSQSFEHRVLSMLMDVAVSGKRATDDEIQQTVRMMRGALDAVVRECLGPAARVRITPTAPHCAAYDAGAFAHVLIEGADAAGIIGFIGVVNAPTLSRYELAHPVVVAEVSLEPLINAAPVLSRVTTLPQFAATWRDVSFVVQESVPWASVEDAIDAVRSEGNAAALATLEGVSFVGVYRGEPLPKGSKSVTVRLHYRDPSKTMRAEDADEPTRMIIEHLGSAVGATVRA